MTRSRNLGKYNHFQGALRHELFLSLSFPKGSSPVGQTVVAKHYIINVSYWALDTVWERYHHTLRDDNVPSELTVPVQGN